jgi:hypothetical protein
LPTPSFEATSATDITSDKVMKPSKETRCRRTARTAYALIRRTNESLSEGACDPFSGGSVDAFIARALYATDVAVQFGSHQILPLIVLN